MAVFTGMTDVQFALWRWISTISQSDIKQLHMRPDYQPNEKTFAARVMTRYCPKQFVNQED